jgi:hypothetical protein
MRLARVSVNRPPATPEVDDDAQAAGIAKLRALAPRYRTELLAVVGLRSQPDAEGVRKKDLLDAARETYEMTIKDIGAGRLRDIEVIHRWSRRWMDAQRAVSKTEEQRAAATEAHLKRMQGLEKGAQQLAELNLGGERLPSSSVAAARYYRVEAEGLLSESRQ